MVKSAIRIGSVAVLLVGAVAQVAHAEPAGRLSYERGAGAEACPDEAALRRSVAARLGEDPFEAPGSRTFRLRIVGEPRLRGTVELIVNDTLEGRRELEAEPEACGELVEAMALAVSLSINPDLVVDSTSTKNGAREASPATPEPVATTLVQHVSSPRPPPTSDARAPTSSASVAPSGPLGISTGLAAHGAIGTGPGIAAGGSAIVRASADWWQLGLEGRLDLLSQSRIGRNGTAHSTLAAGVLAPCARNAAVTGCPLLLLGAMFARSRGVTMERADSGFFAAAGMRIAAHLPLGKNASFEARADLFQALTRVTIDLDGVPVWRAGPSGTLGMGVLWEVL